MPKKPPLMILPSGISRVLAKPFYGVGNKLVALVPGIEYDLRQSDLQMSGEEYISRSLVNALFMFFLFLGLLIFLYLMQQQALFQAIRKALPYSAMIFLLFCISLFRYPKVLAGKKAEQVDKNLIFALKDLHLQISSGVTLYNGLVNVSKAGYGQTSMEFSRVAKEVSVGLPIEKALEKMVVRSKSEFLRRTNWQLINTLRAGASLEAGLRILIEDLLVERRNKIRSYIAELNLWILIYMFFAVVIPTIGSTLMIVLSSFAGFAPTPGFFIFFIFGCLLVQIIIIGFVKSRRPVVNM